MTRRKVVISITEGRVVRDLFENGFLCMLAERDIDVTCVTPAARVPLFVERWTRPGVEFCPLMPFGMTSGVYRALRLRNRLLGSARFLLPLWRCWAPWLGPHDPGIVDAMRGASLAIFTHPMHHAEYPVLRAAGELGVPTLGMLRSWDNLYKGLCIMADTLAVWNEVNRDEAVHLMGYPADQVRVLGGAQFDPYFAQDSVWTRQELAARLRLDPWRPIIVVATLGAFLHLYDETYLMDWLIAEIGRGGIPGRPQVVVRLHPSSRLEQFQKYVAHPDVRISSIQGYIPSLGWTMTRDDVVFVGNLLRHADLVISPGSTITIEAAIFDAPTVVPLFHPYQPELATQQYASHLGSHFKRLRDLDLVPFVDSPQELLSASNRALKDRTWYGKQRSQLVRDYIHFADGRSTQRLVELITELSERGTHPGVFRLWKSGPAHSALSLLRQRAVK